MIKNIQLSEDQSKHYETVKWLINENIRREGKTTLLSLAFLEKAMENKGDWITVFDHHRTLQSDKYLTQTINRLFESEYNQDSLSMETKGSQIRVLAT